MTALSYRPAELSDAADIHALLLTLGPEVPLLVDTLEREEALYAVVRNFARSGESWLALDESGAVVGFVLAAPVEARRHYAEGEALELRYSGVAPKYRRRGIFTELLQRVCARLLPIVTTVGAGNRSGINRRLEGAGFRRSGAAGGAQEYRWEPGAPPAS